MTVKNVTKVVVVGGGTAGWMAAASLSKLIGPNIRVCVVESDEIGTVGVGEATIPTMMTLHQLLKIDEREFMAAVQGTFKLGINFENWNKLGDSYMHAFGRTGQDCWAGGFQHFWSRGKELGISEEYGRYSASNVAAKAGKFAALPRPESKLRLSYECHPLCQVSAQYGRETWLRTH